MSCSSILSSINVVLDVVARCVQQFSFLCRRRLLRRLGRFLLCLLDDDLLSDEPLTELAEEVVEDDGAGDDADEYDDDDKGSIHCGGRVSYCMAAVGLLRSGRRVQDRFWERRR